MPHTHPRLLLPLCALLFFLSGAAALIDQVIWQRVLAIFSGIHIYSVTLIVTTFMAGLGVGSLVGGRYADGIGRRAALVAFAVCELGIGLFALVSPWLYYDVAYLRLGGLARFPALLPLVHFLLLLPPTLLMGASLPLLSKALVRDTRGAACTIGLLYGINTLGAACGAAAAAWVLIGLYGMAGTVRLAALLNLVVAGGAMVLYRSLPSADDDTAASDESASSAAMATRQATAASDESASSVVLATQQPPAASNAPAPQQATGAAVAPGTLRFRTWCALYALSGFVALALELLWFRLLDVMIKSSPYTFGHLLAMFLLFLALGSVVGAVVAPRLRRPDLVFLWAQWGVTATAAVAVLVLLRADLEGLGLRVLPAYWRSPDPLIVFAELSQGVERWPDSLARRQLARLGLVYLAQPAILLAAPTLLMGFCFACIQRAVQTDLGRVGWRVGAIQTSNIVGSILGSLIGGAVLLAFVGSAGTASVLFGCGAVFAWMVAWRLRTTVFRGIAVAAGVGSLVLAAAVPPATGLWSRLHGTPDDPFLVAEDASGVATLQRLDRTFFVMRINGRAQSSVPYGWDRTLLGMLPALMRPDAEDALAIGLGTGNTPWAIGASPGLREINVYEVVRPELDVLEAYGHAGPGYAAADALLADERVRIHFEDGRLALRTSDRRYDLIETDAADPGMAYSGNMYSREFFELVRTRLAPGGVFCSYVPTKRTLRTLVSVFPFVIDLRAPGFSGIAVAANEPLDFDREALAARLASEPVQRYLQASAENDSVSTLLSGFLATVDAHRIDGAAREQALRGDVNTDLFPRDEFDRFPD